MSAVLSVPLFVLSGGKEVRSGQCLVVVNRLHAVNSAAFTELGPGVADRVWGVVKNGTDEEFTEEEQRRNARSWRIRSGRSCATKETRKSVRPGPCLVVVKRSLSSCFSGV